MCLRQGLTKGQKATSRLRQLCYPPPAPRASQGVVSLGQKRKQKQMAENTVSQRPGAEQEAGHQHRRPQAWMLSTGIAIALLFLVLNAGAMNDRNPRSPVGETGPNNACPRQAASPADNRTPPQTPRRRGPTDSHESPLESQTVSACFPGPSTQAAELCRPKTLALPFAPAAWNQH